MIRCPAVLLMLLLGIGLSAQESYPRWFWEAQPPGWASVFSSSEEGALAQAARVLSAYEESVVVGEVQQFQDEAIDDKTWKKTNYEVVSDEAVVKRLQKTLKVWAQVSVHLVTGDRLFLVGPKAATWKGDNQLVESSAEPPWVTQTGTIAGRVIGVGRFTLQGRAADGWVKAEEQALYHLLTSRQLRLAQWKGTHQEGAREELSTLNWVQLKYLVSQVRVEGRWYDREHNDAVVGLSVPVTGVKVYGAPQSK